MTTAEQLRRLSVTALSPMTASFFVDVSEDGRTLHSEGGDEMVPSASMIKTLLVWLAITEAASGRLNFDDRVSLDPDLEADGDGILRLFRNQATVRIGDALKLAVVVSDNWATNLVIRHLGGPKLINDALAQHGFHSSVVKFLGGKHSGSSVQLATRPSWNDGEWGIGAISLADHQRALREILSADFPLIVESFRLQQDKRSLARTFDDGVPLYWKTGTAYGLRHAGALLVDRPDSDVAIGVFTDSLDHSEYVDHPGCVAIGRFTNWALQTLDRTGSLAIIEPIPTLTFDVINPDNVSFALAVLDREDVRGTLRSLETERAFWESAARGERWAAIAFEDERAIGIVGLYSSDTQSPDIGVYIADPVDRGRGFGRQMAEFAIDSARARGAESVGWSCSKQNVQSAALAEALGFTHVATVPNARASPSSLDDELVFRLSLMKRRSDETQLT